jgi:uncharacterized protein YjiS (DUF1127 family)
METASTAMRRVHGQSGYALITILLELGIGAWRALSRQAAELALRQRQAEARDELRHLSDRALKDIGLERSEIDGLFR